MWNPGGSVIFLRISLTASALGPLCGIVGQSIGAVRCQLSSVCRLFPPGRAPPSPTIKAVSATADATQIFMTNLLEFLVIFCNVSPTLTCLLTRQSDPRERHLSTRLNKSRLAKAIMGFRVRNAQAERQRSIFRTKSSMMGAKGEARDGR